jgi:hypothetical protein
LQGESGPVVRRPPSRLGAHRELGAAQGGRDAAAFHQESAVEAPHQLGGALVADAPQAGQHAARTGVEKTCAQADQPLAGDRLAEGGGTAAQGHQLGLEIEVVDLVQAQDAVLRLAMSID